MIPEFATRPELYRWLQQNKTLLMQAKKAAVKRADAVLYLPASAAPDLGVTKAAGETGDRLPTDVLSARLVINTTNILDSHQDVHIPGIWNKTLKESKWLYLVQEHDMSFNKVIAEGVTAYTRNMTWSALGSELKGNTQALIFDASIEPDRNPYMHEQYAKGRVKNHSVGMRYVNLLMCANSDEKWMREEKENWEKHIGDVANRDAADDLGYFFAVTEAKIIEGSAVLIGSNTVTPTISISDSTKGSTAFEPPAGTQAQPRKSRFGSIGSKINA